MTSQTSNVHSLRADYSRLTVKAYYLVMKVAINVQQLSSSLTLS